MIDLYTSPTPNGWKAAMALEDEFGVELLTILAEQNDGRRSVSGNVGSATIDDMC